MQVEVNRLRNGFCTGNLALQKLAPVLLATQDELTTVSDAADCTAINEQILHALESGICADFFTGLFFTWLGQYCIAGLLLFAVIIFAILSNI